MTQRPSEKILFVDDEENILNVAREYFNIKGYDVFTASNGLEAIEVLKNEAIDCCFTDINMPGMDGLELAEYIYNSDNTLPVVIMTGYPSLDNTIRTLKNGVVDFLIKPVSLNQIDLCLRRVLQQRQLFVENIFLKKEVQGKIRLEELNRELQSKIEDISILNQIMRDLTAIGSSSDVFKRLAGLVLEILPADISVFYVINATMNQPFQVVSARANRSPDLTTAVEYLAGSTRHPIPENLIMETVRDGMPLLISHNNGNQNLAPAIQSLMLAPLSIREQSFGVLAAVITRNQKSFTEKDLYYLSFMIHHGAYAIENLALYENIYENLFSTIYAFVRAIGAKDAYTEQHSNRVTGIAVAISRELGCSREEIDILNTAGLLHDIGKIGIRDEILLKPAKLTNEEYTIIKQHSTIGANIVGQLGLWDREAQVIRGHHERFDGTGYPDGLKGEQIPLLARILAVADVYDAMASDRTYRRKMEDQRILEIINSEKGTHFDPVMVEAFMKIFNQGLVEEAVNFRLDRMSTNQPSFST